MTLEKKIDKAIKLLTEIEEEGKKLITDNSEVIFHINLSKTKIILKNLKLLIPKKVK